MKTTEKILKVAAKAKCDLIDPNDPASKRLLTKENKGRPPRRFSLISDLIISKCLFFVVFYFATPAKSSEVIVVPNSGAVAKKVGKVAVE